MNDHVDFILQQWKEARPELDCSPMGAIGRLNRISKFLGTQIDECITSFGISRLEFDILATLRRAEAALTPTQLYKDTMLSSGAMSTRLDALEKRGLVARIASKEDRRSVVVELTNEGREFIDEVVEAHVDNEKNLLDVFSDEEEAQLNSLLRKWLSHYEQSQ
ncbi:MarR family transcriptional regulator [Marinomonas mediterranea]|uniref:MarR family winged helix-turn-helix transcriptional regulator n=1 Tax=Marinomonas mediterranea TaxID=119864 RepID=UPI00234A2493|nr:MarR family transcriptional regulator [Marinomonas mediterranea]WCN12871.1 MarR family transcriptional regulator [Marinomonas mediterranea]